MTVFPIANSFSVTYLQIRCIYRLSYIIFNRLSESETDFQISKPYGNNNHISATDSIETIPLVDSHLCPSTLRCWFRCYSKNVQILNEVHLPSLA